MFGKKEEKSIIDIAKEFEDNTSNPETPAPNPTDKSVPEVTHIKDTLASLLEHVKDVNTFVEFNLPSLGKLYHDYDKETVKIRPLKFADEKKIQQQAAGDRALDALNSILASCIEGPKFKTLTIPDKIYCLYRLRQLSYGSTYTYPLKCDACTKENEVNPTEAKEAGNSNIKTAKMSAKELYQNFTNKDEATKEGNGQHTHDRNDHARKGLGQFGNMFGSDRSGEYTGTEERGSGRKKGLLSFLTGGGW